MASRLAYISVFVAGWLFIMLVLHNKSVSPDSARTEEVERKLRAALDDLQTLRIKNKELSKVATDLR